MTDQHPITPPPELFKQWEDDILNERDNVDHVLDCAWRDGFRAGADQELDACCEHIKKWFVAPEYRVVQLRAARRPQPPSLAEGPTDEEVDAWVDQQGFIRGHGDHPCGFWIDDGDAGALVRAALARWGKLMTKPTPLSPAARAVFEAFNSKFDWIEDGVPGPQFRAIADELEGQDQLTKESD